MKAQRIIAASILALAIATTTATPTFAQDAQAPQDDSAQAELESEGEIVITATRRASPLAEVPIAVSAVTAQSLQNSGASDIRQLNQLAPSLLVSSTGTEANGSARIRGIGTVGDNPGLESSVAVFIDGVYRSRTGAGLNELGEIDRVEVLRGPQGTLFGRNASAGLLNIVSKSPSFKPGATVEATFGNYDFMRFAGRVTGPITEKIAASVDAVYSKRDGFLTTVNAARQPVGETNDRDRYFVRGQLLVEPNDALSIRLIGDYTNRDESCCGAAYIETRELRNTTSGTTTVASSNRVSDLLTALGGNPNANAPFSRNIQITPGREYISQLKDWGVSGEVNYDLGSAKLTSITAYRNYRSEDSGDLDYNGADLLYRDPNGFRQFKTFTQELRVQGSAFNEVLDWLVGGYYANETLTLADNIRFGADYGRFAACRLMQGSSLTSNLPTANLALCARAIDGNAATPDVGNLIAGTQANLNAGLTAAFQAQGAPLSVAQAQAAAISGGLGTGLTALANMPTGAGDTNAGFRQKSENWALFTHNIINITDRLSLTIGLRYTNESKSYTESLANNNATCAALQTRVPGSTNDLFELATTPALGSAAALAQGILTLGCLGNSSTSLNALDLSDSFSDGELSGTGVLSYRPTDDLMLYASYSKGYKAGGYNLDRFQLGTTGLNPVPAVFSPRSNADASSLRFAAEKVNAYELGFKFDIRGFGVNFAAFRQEFQDFQLNTFNGTSFVVQNINGCSGPLSATRTCASEDVMPGLVSQGFELEANVVPVKDVRLTGGMTYTHAKLSDRLVGSSTGAVPLDPALFLLPGNINSNAPRFVTTASFSYTPDLGFGGLTGLIYVDGRRTSSYNTGSDLYPEKLQEGYSVFNARIGVRGKDNRWAVEFWGQNIFDTDYTQVAFSSPLQSSSPATSTRPQLNSGAPIANQLISAYLAEPRTFGITLRGKF